MQRSIGRRIEMLERSIPVPRTAELFVARAEKHAQRTGTTLDAAIQSLIVAVSDDELYSLASEFERIAFGDDTAARDAAKRTFLGLAPNEPLPW
jgi:hypothetical protein